MAQESVKKSSSAVLAATWLIVVLPTLWGLTYTIENALKLFRTNGPAASGVVTPPASAR